MPEHAHQFDRRSVISRPSSALEDHPPADDRRELVVVGNGMAASRLLDDLAPAQGDGIGTRIKVFGEEPGGSL